MSRLVWGAPSACASLDRCVEDGIKWVDCKPGMLVPDDNLQATIVLERKISVALFRLRLGAAAAAAAAR